LLQEVYQEPVTEDGIHGWSRDPRPHQASPMLVATRVISLQGLYIITIKYVAKAINIY